MSKMPRSNFMNACRGKLCFVLNLDSTACFEFTIDKKSFEPKHVLEAALQTNKSIGEVDEACKKYANLDIFDTVDKKVTGSIVGSIFVKKFVFVAKEYLGLNPSPTGNPDLVPVEYLREKKPEQVNWDQFPYGGIEVKTSSGDLPKGVTAKLENRASRIKYLQNVVWKGHHTAINNLLGLYWDYYEGLPTIMAAFYSNELQSSDFTNTIPKPGGGHTTSVCITKASARKKMAKNWVFCVDLPEYVNFFKKNFEAEIKSKNRQAKLCR